MRQTANWQLYQFEIHKTALLEWLHENEHKREVSANTGEFANWTR